MKSSFTAETLLVPRRHRDDHRHALAIFDIDGAEKPDQIALLQQDADEDVAGGRYREQQVTGRQRLESST
ncbi:MAG TPA: hypothetical protein VIK79_07480 [Xanthobacteraceae bacterium]